MGQRIGIFISSSIFMNLNSVNFCNNYLSLLLSKPLTEPLLQLDSYIFIIGVVFIVATCILIFIPEEVDEQRVHKGLSETFSIIFQMSKNKYLLNLCVIVLLSKIGQIFFNSVSGLVLIQKGISEQTLTNISTLLIPVEMALTYYSISFKNDFIPKYLNYLKYLLVLYCLELMFLFGFSYVNEFGGYYLTISLIIALGSIKSCFTSLAFMSMQGFYNSISDKNIGVTYITAIYTINNLSYKWPGIFIYSSIDVFGYEVIGVASFLYSLFFYNFFSKRLVELENEKPSVWLVQLNNKLE
jgi:hypothetical protein